MRQRKSWASSSFVGALKAVSLTPSGLTETTWRMMPPLPEVSMPCTTSSTERFEPAVDCAKSRSSRSASSASQAASAALPAILPPLKPGVADVSTSASTKPLPTRSGLAMSPICSTASASWSATTSSCSIWSFSFATAFFPLAFAPLPCEPLSFLPFASLPMASSCPTSARRDGMRHPQIRAALLRCCTTSPILGRMRLLVPGRSGLPALAELDAAGLFAAYAAPEPRWLRCNMVATLDGAATGADGRSGSINNDADHVVFEVLRASSHVIVVGAGTIRTEGYPPLSVQDSLVALRRDRGLARRAAARRREQPRRGARRP